MPDQDNVPDDPSGKEFATGQSAEADAEHDGSDKKGSGKQYAGGGDDTGDDEIPKGSGKQYGEDDADEEGGSGSPRGSGKQYDDN